jgi:ABC-type microcin C transport system permease subunit YejB
MKVPQFAVAGRPACSNPRHILMKGDFQIMTRYVVKRILLAIVSVLVICAITFFAMNAIPGGPFNSEKALSEATKAVLMERYNLDKPVPVQFVLYMRNLLRGDFGVSLKTGRDISGTLFSCFKVSARLGATAAVCAVACGIVLGSLAALFRNRLIDRVIVFFTTLFTAMPSFVFATFLMLVFCITLKWLPVWDASNKSLILPVIALMAYPMAYVTRLTKTSMLDSLGQDYIRTARETVRGRNLPRAESLQSEDEYKRAVEKYGEKEIAALTELAAYDLVRVHGWSSFVRYLQETAKSKDGGQAFRRVYN